MNSEEVLKEYICSRYKSVRQFCIEFNLKYSTIVAMLSRGLRNSNIDTVFEVCKALNISVEPLVKEGIIVEFSSMNRLRTQKRLEAYALHLKLMFDSNSFTIDGVPLSSVEKQLFIVGIDSMIESIKKLRAQNQKLDKENKE